MDGEDLAERGAALIEPAQELAQLSVSHPGEFGSQELKVVQSRFGRSSLVEGLRLVGMRSDHATLP